ncbi:hypothetical protein NG798_16300 [Ancylothrix sp. C2]|uniref:hypothetical protein n=1 Tax=Ancylothrix sp. D3o TaxID=2953691 RepID=UPI0021BA4D13|nr:hypothetical protein [Ancylothrix sp. D3o]MCT7951363.1 hypothetical protein [Ancylothrix sp. D3o]
MKYFRLFLPFGLSLAATVNMSSLQTTNAHSPTFEIAQTPIISDIGVISSDSDCDQPGGYCRQDR